MKKAAFLCPGLFFILVISACSLLPQSGGENLPNSTAVYGTVSAGLTETGQSPDLPRVETITPIPYPSSTSVAIPAASTTPSPAGAGDKPATRMPTRPTPPCNLAAPGRPYVDITIPDGTRLRPGEGFSKTWRLVNAGSCKWTQDYAIAWFSGEIFGAIREQKFGSEVRPGQPIDITVDMVAPRQPGIYQSNWKLRDPDGKLFGIGPNGDAPFWVRIEVEVVATATTSPQPTLTYTPTPAVVAKGAIQLNEGKAFDLDTGKENTGSGDDLELRQPDGSGLMLALLDGSALLEMPVQSPGLSECQNASLKNPPVPAASLKEGICYCYRTNQGLPGYFRITTLALDDNQLVLDFLTWAIP